MGLREAVDLASSGASGGMGGIRSGAQMTDASGIAHDGVNHRTKSKSWTHIACSMESRASGGGQRAAARREGLRKKFGREIFIEKEREIPQKMGERLLLTLCV